MVGKMFLHLTTTHHSRSPTTFLFVNSLDDTCVHVECLLECLIEFVVAILAYCNVSRCKSQSSTKPHKI